MQANRKAPTWFFAIFGCMGLAFLIFTFPLFKLIAARGWVATPCMIESSTVERHPGRKNSTYNVAISYRYVFDAQTYTGTRYQFFTGSTSGRDGKAAVVARHPAGSQATCYVNPDDPAESVIVRGLTPDMWFCLIPLAFMAIGFGGIYYSRRGKGNAATAWQPQAMKRQAKFDEVASGGTLELKPQASPMMKLIGVVFFAAIWNGIISLLLREVVDDWSKGNGRWGMTLFSVPFALVGIGAIIAVFYFFLSLFNPRAHVRITPGNIALGDTLRLEWRLEGRVTMLTAFQISLVGTEEATYRSGTGSSRGYTTDRSDFKRIELLSTTSRAEFAAGESRVTLPRDTMHSLDTGSNKITWKIQIKGTIPRWPDLGDDYPITVLPVRKEALS